MEYTQEQLDAMIAEAKKGLFTEDELNRRVTSEVDRRVETGIQKGLETAKSKWQTEYEATATLSAEEKARKAIEEAQTTLTEKEKTVLKKANTLEAKEMLTEAGISKAQYEKMISLLVTDNEETTKSNVASYIEVFNTTKGELETKIKAEVTKIAPPNTDPHSGVVTKTEFDKMGFAEKVAFKASNPELYSQFIK